MFWKKRQIRTSQKTNSPVHVRKRSWFGFFGESLTAMAILGLLMCCTLFVALLWGWSQRDSFLAGLIRSSLNEKFPEWNITFDSVELDNRGRVILSYVKVNPEGTSTPLCTVQGMRVTVDRDLLLNERMIDILSIEINRPELLVVRGKDGLWNFQKLPFPEAKAGASPLIKIRDANVALQWEHPEFDRAIRAQVQAVDVDLTPTSSHQYQFEGIGREETLGSSQFSGTFDSLHKTWEFSGDLKGLQIDQPFLQAAALFSPDANRVMAQLGKSYRSSPEELAAAEQAYSVQGGAAPLFQTADAVTQAVGENRAESEGLFHQISSSSSGQKTPENQTFSLKLTANLRFHASRQKDSEPDFSLFANLVNGQLAHPDIPLPLDKISGQIAVDRLGVRVDQIQLASAHTSAEMTGAWGWGSLPLPGGVEQEMLVTLKNYRVTPQTRDYLPHSVQKIYDELHPSGVLSVSFGLKRLPDNRIDFDLFSAEVQEGSIRHEMFAYPIVNVTGTIVRTDHGAGPEAWALAFNGQAAGQAVTLTGNLIDPGPNCETVFDINVDQLPIDDQFYRALQPRQREVLEYIRLQGMANVHCRIVRKMSLGRKPIVRLKADVYDASLRVKSFPLNLQQLSGHVESDENGWRFTRLSAMHGEAQVNGYGDATPVGEDWKLDLTVTAQQASFNHDLYLALKESSQEVSRVWDTLRPRGNFRLTTRIEWTSGHDRAYVRVPQMQLLDCEVNPTVYPWRVSGIHAAVAIGTDGVVAFENLKAHHNQCQIEAAGSFTPHKDHWQLRFDRLILDDLLPDHEFLAAQPAALRNLMGMVKVHQPASMSGMMELKGDYVGKVVTAAWETKAVLNNVDIQAGIDINNVSGTIELRGMVDRHGVATVPVGNMSIDSCWVMGYQITDIKGPFRIDADHIVLGSSKKFEPESPGEEWTTISRQERVAGRIFNGEIFLDMLAKRTESMPYWLRCELHRADLEQWAIQNNYGQSNIRGEVNGYIDLAGDSVSPRNTVGNGSVLINPAALYELPVMLQMFQKLSFAPADDTAFRHAYATFRVMDEKFVLDEVQLLGDSVSLLGKGTIRFDRTIDLDFVYRPPRRTRINLASQVLNRLEGVLPVLFTVEVEGTLDLPRVNVRGGMRETLNDFAKLLEPGAGGLRVPKVMPPPRIQLPAPPQAAQPLIPAF